MIRELFAGIRLALCRVHHRLCVKKLLIRRELLGKVHRNRFLRQNFSIKHVIFNSIEDNHGSLVARSPRIFKVRLLSSAVQNSWAFFSAFA